MQSIQVKSKFPIFLLIVIIAISSGCIVDNKNPDKQQNILSLPLSTTHTQIPEISSPVTHTILSIPQQSPTSVLPTQNPGKITPVTVMTTVTPHFTGTISIGVNKLTIGSNQSPPMTEDQAWKHAEQYLAKFGMQEFNQAEIIPLGQGKHTYENGTQTWTWGFRIKRCTEGGGCYGLAVVTIDANDGHLIGIGFLD